MTLEVEEIRSDDKRICILIRRAAEASETAFVTAPDGALQVGAISHPSGHEIGRHAHRPIQRHLATTEEVVVVQKGRCEVDVYDDERTLVATRMLETGDVLIMVAGGHGFRMMEDTVLLEIKQGPYPGPSEKVPF